MKKMHFLCALVLILGAAQLEGATWPYDFQASVSAFQKDILDPASSVTRNVVGQRNIYAYLYLYLHNFLNKSLQIPLSRKIETLKGQSEFLSNNGINNTYKNETTPLSYKGGLLKFTSAAHTAAAEKLDPIPTILKWLALTEDGNHNLNIYFNYLALSILYEAHEKDYGNWVNATMKMLDNPSTDNKNARLEFIAAFKFVPSDFVLLEELKSADATKFFTEWGNSLFGTYKLGYKNNKLNIKSFVDDLSTFYNDQARLAEKTDKITREKEEKIVAKHLKDLTTSLQALTKPVEE